MNFTQKCAILSLVFTCLIPYQCFGATAEPSGILTNQSLYGFKLSIVNMPIDAAALLHGQGLGLIVTPPEYVNLLQAREAYEWQISYGFDDFALFVGGNLGFYKDEGHLSISGVSGVEHQVLLRAHADVQSMNAQGLYDPLAWLEPSAYWRIGGAYQAMDWLTLSLNFQQDLTYANQNVIYLGSQVNLNPAFSLELIGLMGIDASKGALLKTSYHF
jgi:hypothetical protein